MNETVDVTRSVDLDLPPADAWELIGDGTGWTAWMVDDAQIEVAPGASGDVVDGGQRREVSIDRVDVGDAVTFHWWPTERPDQTSTVELRIVPSAHGTILEIIETFPVTGTTFAAAAGARSAWSGRARRINALRRLLVAA